jgi:uncharacterized protein YkwD
MVLGISLASALGCTAPAEVYPQTPAEYEIARDVFNRTNTERAARGLQPLTWDPQLASVGAAWAREMAATGYRHMAPPPKVGGYWWAGDLVHHLGPVSNALAGEPTSGALFRDWMWSSAHRVLMVSPNVDAGAVGVYCAPDGHAWAVFLVGVVKYRGQVSQPANGGPRVQDTNDGFTCSR